MVEQSLRERREAVIAEHIRAETHRDVEGVLATFPAEPSYHVVPLRVTHDGPVAVRDLLTDLMAAFPDLDLKIQVLHHADDAVIVEGRMTGTHTAFWAGMEPIGGRMDLPSAVFFRFDGDRLTNETVYFDVATLQGQLGGR